jgi:hypothetical protein
MNVGMIGYGSVAYGMAGFGAVVLGSEPQPASGGGLSFWLTIARRRGRC